MKILGLRDCKLFKMKYFKLVCIILIILSFVGMGFYVYFSNIRDRGEVARARQALYQATDTDKSKVIYDHYTSYKNSQEVQLSNIYHIFHAKKVDGEDYNLTYLVGKGDFTVYIYDKHGIIIPYEEYINSDTLLGQYFASLKEINYEDIPPATKNYLEKKGEIAFFNKVKEIMDNADSDAVNKAGGPVIYVDYIINGVSQKKLNKDDFWVR